MNEIRIQFNYGTIAGITTFFTFLLVLLIGYDPLGEAEYLSFIVPVIFLLLAMHAVRKVQPDKRLPFRKALFTGWIVSIVYASMFAMLMYLFGLVISDTFYHTHVDGMITNLDAARSLQLVPDARIDGWVSQWEHLSLEGLAITDFNGKLVGGLLISLIIAAIMRRPARKAQLNVE